jgi:K+-transporting ATPase ATPase C chain
MLGRHLLTSIVVLAALSVITGLLYPLAVAGAAQLLFPRQANGSMIAMGGTTAGSLLIGQPFKSPRYFWSRPSATGGHPYNPLPSSGSNLGPTNPLLLARIEHRVRELRAADPTNAGLVPVDLVTASASGLDPHISVAAALFQIPRVARARGIAEAEIRALVDRFTEGRQFGLLGEPRVHVLMLNLALDERTPAGREN